MSTREHTRKAANAIDQREGDRIAAHILELVKRITTTHQQRQENWPWLIRQAREQRTTCYGCGCLVLETEHCPGCRAQREAAA